MADSLRSAASGLAGAAAAAGAVAFFGSYVAARAALRIEPLVVLRD